MPIIPERLVKSGLVKARLIPVRLAGADLALPRELALPFYWNSVNGLDPFAGYNLSMIGGKLVIAPTLGDEMWDAAASVFTSGTYAWAAQGTNLIANVGNALVITYVDNADGAKELLADAADLNANLTIGQWYQLQATQSMPAGSAYVMMNGMGNVFGVSAVAAPAVMKLYNLATSAINNYIVLNSFGAGEVVTLDNLSLKPLTLPTMLAGCLPASRSNVIVKAAWTATVNRGRVFGVAACLDSYSNPLNGLFGYHTGYYMRLVKLVNGIWTSVIAIINTYVADANVEIRKSGSSVSLYYNNAQVGTTQAVNDPSVINNRLHAPFASDSDSRCDSFSVVAN